MRNRKNVSGPMWLAAAGLLLSVLSAGFSETTYRDPENRFTLAVPAGWKVRALGDGVQVVRGDSYASVLILEHTSDASTLIDELSQQMGKKWQRFEVAGRGEATIAGRKASVASFSGVNTQGAEAVLRLVGITSHNTGYVLVTGSPKNELPKVQETLAQIERSFTVLETELGATKETQEPTLGMEATDLSGEDAPVYGLGEASGVLVVQLVEHGPAQQAGVELHDVVVAAGRQNIDGAAALQQVVKSHAVGELLELEVLRLGADRKVERKTVRVRIGSAEKHH